MSYNFCPNYMKFAQFLKIYIPNIHVSFYLDISKALGFIENIIIHILQTSSLYGACDHFHIANTTKLKSMKFV